MSHNFGLSVALPRQLSSPSQSSAAVQSAIMLSTPAPTASPARTQELPGFWDFLYQLQVSYRLCDIQLCIRDVSVPGELPISHCIPVHKLVLVGSSLFFRRCLDNGELLDMYNFDGVQPQNLQLLVDYMYHQVSWDVMMANDEAAEVARILEIVCHESPLNSTSPGKDPDKKNVLVIQMQDAHDKQLDPLSLDHIKNVVGHSKTADNSPKPSNMKKGTRVFIKNLEEELKKHNIGPKKKVVVLESQNLDETLDKMVHNSALEVADLPNESAEQLQESVEGNIDGIEALADNNVELMDTIPAVQFHQTGVGSGTVVVVNSGQQDIVKEEQIQNDGVNGVQVDSLDGDVDQVHSENVVVRVDTTECESQPDVNDSFSQESSIINLPDMSIKMSKEGSVEILDVVQNSSSLEVDNSAETNVQSEPTESNLKNEVEMDNLPVCESETEPTSNISEKDPNSISPNILVSDSEPVLRTPTLKTYSRTRSKTQALSSLSPLSEQSTSTKTDPISDDIDQSTVSNVTPVVSTEVIPAIKAIVQPQSEPSSPYSTRFRGQKRVVETTLPASKRRKGRVENGSDQAKKVIIIQPEVKVIKENNVVKMKIIAAKNKDTVQMKAAFVEPPEPHESVTEPAMESTETEMASASQETEVSLNEQLNEVQADNDEDLNEINLEIVSHEVKREPEQSTSVAVEETLTTEQSSDHIMATMAPAAATPDVTPPVKRRVGRPRKSDVQQRQDEVVQGARQAVEEQYPYVCTQCNKRFKNQTGLAIHDHWKHNKTTPVVTREGSYDQECQTCQKVCASYQALVQHMRCKHGTAPTHQCEDCQQYFSSLRVYRSHRIKVHNDVLYSCDICGISFKSPEGHKIHMFKQHTEAENSHVCYVCGKTFKMKHELATHLKVTHAPTRAFPCQLCERAFKNKSTLKRHLETFHTEAKTIACPECSLLFKTRADMQTHRKKHFRAEKPLRTRLPGEEDKGFQCSKCDATFKKFYQCQAHERVVHLEKESGIVYVCTMCKKSYSAKNYLLQHIRQMHLPKRHKCAQCLYEFTHAYMLRKHMPKCKGYPIVNKPYRCSRCQRSFNLKGNLTRHIRSTNRCRGAVQESYPDYIVVLSSDTKKGIVEGSITGTNHGAPVAHQETDQVTLEALQASEALQQLQASGGQVTEQGELSNVVVEHDEELLQSGELVNSVENEPEEVILEQGQVILENVQFDPAAIEGGGQIVQQDGEVIQDASLEETLAQMTSLKDILSLPDGLRTMNIQKDQYGNMIIEVTNSADGEAENVIVTEDGEESTPKQQMELVQIGDSSSTSADGLQQVLRTPQGEILVPMTVTDGSVEGATSYQLVEEPATEIHVGGDGTQQLFQVVEQGTESIHQLVQSSHQLEGGIQMIQKNGTIQLVQTAGSGVQVLEAVGEHVDVQLPQATVESTQGSLIVKQEEQVDY